MAYYRANPLEYQGINQQPPVYNRPKWTGYAVSQTELDQFGRPKIVATYNRQTHQRTDVKGGLKPLNEERPLAPTDVQKFIPAPIRSKAYKDGQEFLQAEKDFRAKELYLDSITPSRGRWPANLTGNPNALSGAVSDAKGNTYAYDAVTRAMTGQFYWAPGGGKPPPSGIRPGSTVRKPVLVETKGNIINTLPDGSTVIGSSSGVMRAPPIHAATEPVSHPTLPDWQRTAPGEQPVSMDIDIPLDTPSRPAPGPVPTQVATDFSDPGNVAAILKHNTVYGGLKSMAVSGPFDSTAFMPQGAINVTRGLPSTQGVLVTQHAPKERGANLLNMAKLDIPTSLHVAKVTGAIVTSDLGVRTGEGVLSTATMPIDTQPIVPPLKLARGSKRIAEDPAEGQRMNKKAKSNPVASVRTRPVLARKAKAKLPPPVSGIAGDPTVIKGVRPLAKLRKGDPEGYVAGATQPEVPYKEPRLRTRPRAAEEVFERPAKRQKTAPKRIARAGPSLAVDTTPVITDIPPPQLQMTVPVAKVRKLAKVRKDDPEFGIGSSVPSVPYVEPQLRSRVRKSQEPVTPRPTKKQRTQ